MNTDQAIKYTCISITIRWQPYVWHTSKSAMLGVKNMQEYSKPEDRLGDLS